MYYNQAIIEKGDSKYPTLRHMLQDNLALLTARIQATGVFDAVFISKCLVEMKTAESSRSCTVFPLFLIEDHESPQANFSDKRRTPNLNPKVLQSLAQKLGVKPEGDFGLPDGLTPNDVLWYAYAVFHSPGYRTSYAEFLKIDFPRLPLTGHQELFRALARLGGELVTLHLVESPCQTSIVALFDRDTRAWRYQYSDGKKPPILICFAGPAEPVVEKVSYGNKTVWIDKAQRVGFAGVPEDVWNFHIGGYQVCAKWLKDRKGRGLSAEDIIHYHRIVVALHETIRLMAEIDKTIDAHGGWPAAFDSANDRQDRGQGHQPLRRRSAESV